MGPIEIWRKNISASQHLGKKGALLLWTKIHVAPLGFEHQVPYIVGIVQIDEEKMPLEIVDCNEEDLNENMNVQVVIRKIGKPSESGVIQYGLKAKPL